MSTLLMEIMNALFLFIAITHGLTIIIRVIYKKTVMNSSISYFALASALFYLTF